MYGTHLGNPRHSAQHHDGTVRDLTGKLRTRVVDQRSEKHALASREPKTVPYGTGRSKRCMSHVIAGRGAPFLTK